MKVHQSAVGTHFHATCYTTRRWWPNTCDNNDDDDVERVFQLVVSIICSRVHSAQSSKNCYANLFNEWARAWSISRLKRKWKSHANKWQSTDGHWDVFIMCLDERCSHRLWDCEMAARTCSSLPRSFLAAKREPVMARATLTAPSDPVPHQHLATFVMQ